jgi:hypothetical protein
VERRLNQEGAGMRGLPIEFSHFLCGFDFGTELERCGFTLAKIVLRSYS